MRDLVLRRTGTRSGMTGTSSLVKSLLGPSAERACDAGVNRAGIPCTPTSIKKNSLLTHDLIVAMSLAEQSCDAVEVDIIV